MEVFRNLCWVHLKEAKQFSSTPYVFRKNFLAKIMRDTPPINTNCFEVVNGKTLVGLLDFLVKDVGTVLDCEKHCSISQDQHGVLCKAAIFYASDRECAIVADDRRSMPDFYRVVEVKAPGF